MTSTARTLLKIAAAGLVPAAMLALPVHAQEGERDPGQGRMVLEVQQMREELRDLRGLVEDQQREIQRLRERQRDQYMDLDRRLQEAGSRPEQAPDEPFPRVAEGVRPRPPGDEEPGIDPAEVSPIPETPDRPEVSRDDEGPEVRDPIVDQSEVVALGERDGGVVADLGVPSDSEQEDYDAAFRALRELRYADAAEGFAEFLERHPDSAYAPNAKYWLGETFYVTRDFETALSVFNDLVESYPDSNKVGDAMLKVGFSHYERREWSEARAALEQVKAEHEGTTLERLADNRLRTMRLEGHL